MKKKIVGIITSMTMLISAMPQVIVNAAEEITISTATELKAFADSVNSGDTYEGKTVTLTQDIDLSGICGEDIDGEEVSWTPIGTQSNMFLGNFEGCGYEISNIYINNPDGDSIGLFGRISGARIWDLTVSGIIKGDMYVGGIAGVSSDRAKITGCVNKADIIGLSDDVGGITGLNFGTIDVCANLGSVSGNGFNTGGIAGSNCRQPNSSIRACIYDCYNKGAVSSSGDAYSQPDRPNGTGGIVGENWNGVIWGAHNVGIVTALNAYVGGVVGSNFGFNYGEGRNSEESSVLDCYFLKTPELNSDINAVGFDCYSEGTAAYETNPQQLASGEIAYLLNRKSINGWWYQNIGEDAYPVVDESHSLVFYDKERNTYYNPDEFMIEDDYIYQDTFRNTYIIGYTNNSNDDITIMVAEYSDKDVLLSIGSYNVSHDKGNYGQYAGVLTREAEYIKIFAWKNGISGMQPACEPVTFLYDDIPISHAD